MATQLVLTAAALRTCSHFSTPKVSQMKDAIEMLIQPNMVLVLVLLAPAAAAAAVGGGSRQLLVQMCAGAAKPCDSTLQHGPAATAELLLTCGLDAVLAHVTPGLKARLRLCCASRTARVTRGALLLLLLLLLWPCSPCAPVCRWCAWPDAVCLWRSTCRNELRRQHRTEDGTRGWRVQHESVGSTRGTGQEHNAWFALDRSQCWCSVHGFGFSVLLSFQLLCSL